MARVMHSQIAPSYTFPEYIDEKAFGSTPQSTSKIRRAPFLRKVSDSEKGGLDLSQSIAENVNRGALVASIRRDAIPPPGSRHDRTQSQGSIDGMIATGLGVHGLHNGVRAYGSYAPAKPYTPTRSPNMTPPISAMHSHHNSFSAPGTQLSRTGSSTPLHMTVSGDAYDYDTASPMSKHKFETPSRGSIDSLFRPRRSRTNTFGSSNQPLSQEEQEQAIQQLRAEFNAREAKKDEKHREKEDRKKEKIEKRNQRKDRANSAKSKGDSIAVADEHERTESEKFPNIDEPERKSVRKLDASPLRTVEYESTVSQPVDIETTDPRRTRPTMSGRGSYSSVGSKSLQSRYHANSFHSQRRLPATAASVSSDDEPVAATTDTKSPAQSKMAERFERAQQGKKARKNTSVKKAGKAIENTWRNFWFRVKTAWLKFKRSVSRGKTAGQT